MLLTIGF